MGRYWDVRGHVGCDEDQVAEMRGIVDRVAAERVGVMLPAEQARLYTGGWRFPERTINWTSYVFFGATMRWSGRELVRAQLDEIAALDEVTGLFLIDDDELSESLLWIVEGGAVTERSREFLRELP
ncbi:hypothetical protein J2S43_003231 [Catenuloplanes nepalensis]|uniref:Uncharacterized protein n=1 Tax=Catenuloplanes nepalensis TaxID=587533 RepID=A0ABT9MTK2_9ACTN|nr:hypothetical protein [Catenuloplanes nepalensis]MDP9794719.1 hypothetical protein [Catenuloplanes nepalensis]